MGLVKILHKFYSKEVPSEAYFSKHLLEEDSILLRDFINSLAKQLQTPAAMLAIGSSTKNRRKTYRDIDIKIVPEMPSDSSIKKEVVKTLDFLGMEIAEQGYSTAYSPQSPHRILTGLKNGRPLDILVCFLGSYAEEIIVRERRSNTLPFSIVYRTVQ